MPPTPKKSRRHEALAGILLVLGSVLVFLLAAEFAGRALAPSASMFHFPNYIEQQTGLGTHEMKRELVYDRDIGHLPRPNHVWQVNGEHYSFNAKGFRNQNMTARPPERPMVLAVGDSFTEGHLVSDDHTWTAFLERMTGLNIVNGGVRGYGVDQMVLRAELEAPRLKPDAMMLAFIPDNIERALLRQRFHYHKPYFELGPGDSLVLKNVPVPQTPPERGLWRNVLGYSYLADFIMRRLHLQRVWYGGYEYGSRNADELMCRLMTRFGKLNREVGSKGMVIALYEEWAWSEASIRDRDRKAVANALACAAKAGLATVDTWDGFAAAGTAANVTKYYQNYHHSVAGQELVAKIVAADMPAKLPLKKN